ncbi:MAG: MurR/RpiR family transcriptional regulator [Thomasclavelia sp.]|jgi:RpiR family carbohydrate utilization transcriptional regulator|nr:MurR/RpiR family transcriptional regulator [Thomasclavelia sp.]
MKSLFYRLIIFIDSSSHEDTNYKIAMYMAHNFTKVAKMGISQLADECFVSPATISRFCRTLGYENFAHLKQECAYFQDNERKFNNLINIPVSKMINDPTEVTREYCQQVCDVINELPKRLDWEVIDDVLRSIHDSDNVCFFGTQFSHSAALHFQTDLLMLEKFSSAYMEQETQMSCAKNMTETSVAIIVSVNGNFINSSPKTLAYLVKSGCTIVLMTSNVEADAHLQPDYIISLGEAKNSKIGKHTLLTTMELMSLRYYALYYPEVENKTI